MTVPDHLESLFMVKEGHLLVDRPTTVLTSEDTVRIKQGSSACHVGSDGFCYRTLHKCGFSCLFCLPYSTFLEDALHVFGPESTRFVPHA